MSQSVHKNQVFLDRIERVKKSIDNDDLWNLMRDARDGFIEGVDGESDDTVYFMRAWYLYGHSVACPVAQGFFKSVKEKKIQLSEQTLIRLMLED